MRPSSCCEQLSRSSKLVDVGLSPLPQMFNDIGVKVSLARKPQMDRSDRSDMLHGAIIFTYIYQHLP